MQILSITISKIHATTSFFVENAGFSWLLQEQYHMPQSLQQSHTVKVEDIRKAIMAYTTIRTNRRKPLDNYMTSSKHQWIERSKPMNTTICRKKLYKINTAVNKCRDKDSTTNTSKLFLKSVTSKSALLFLGIVSAPSLK